MGGCCSTQAPEHETHIELQTAPLAPHGRVVSVRRQKPDGSPPLSEAAVSQFLRKARSGFEVLVLLASGHGVECCLQVDADNQLVRLSKGALCRDLPFAAITRVLSLPEELTRIRTEAKLDTCCSALYTEEDSSCVVFCFDTPEENQAFVAAAYRFIASVSKRVSRPP